MMAQTIEPEAVRLLREIIHGDDLALQLAIEEGRKLLAAMDAAKRPPDDIDRILEIAANEYGLTVPALLEDKRTRARVVPRQVAMWLCRTVTRQPFHEIGRRMNGRHHGTVLWAMGAVDDLVDTDPRFRATLARLLGQARVVCGPVEAKEDTP